MSDSCNVNMLYYSLLNADESFRMSLIDSATNGICWMKFRYIKDIVNTRVSMFRYKGLTDAIPELDSKVLEMSLLMCTNLCFYNCPSTGWGLFRITNIGSFGMYRNPQQVDLKPLNNSVSLCIPNVPYSDIIRIKDNTLDIPAFLPIMEYIDKLSYIEECLDQVLDNTTLPLILSGPKEMTSQMKIIDAKLSDKHHHRYITDKNAVNPTIQAFDLNTQQPISNIYDLRLKYRAECYSSLGIYTVNEKSERMVTDEVSILNDITDLVYEDAKDSRKEAIDELNKRGGFHIEFVESRLVNHETASTEKASETKEEVKAQVTAIKEVAPDAIPSVNSVFKVEGSKK